MKALGVSLIALVVASGCAHGGQHVGGLELTVPDGFQRHGTVEEGVVFTSVDGRTTVEAFVAEASPPCTVPNACRDRMLMDLDADGSLAHTPREAVTGFRLGAFEVMRVAVCPEGDCKARDVVYLASSDGVVTWVLRVSGPRADVEAVAQKLADSVRFEKTRERPR